MAFQPIPPGPCHPLMIQCLVEDPIPYSYSWCYLQPSPLRVPYPYAQNPIHVTGMGKNCQISLKTDLNYKHTVLFKIIGPLNSKRLEISVLRLLFQDERPQIQWCQLDVLIMGPSIFLHIWLPAVNVNHTPFLLHPPPTPKSQLSLSLFLSHGHGKSGFLTEGGKRRFWYGEGSGKLKRKMEGKSLWIRFTHLWLEEWKARSYSRGIW